MAKSKTPKPPKSRPSATSGLSQPLVATENANLTAFAPDASLFAQVSRAADRCRLRVYAADPSAVIADYLLPENTQCKAIAWIELNNATLSESNAPKKRKAPSKSNAASSHSEAQWHIALGLSNGTILLYAPKLAKVTRILVAASSDSTNEEVTSLAYDANAAQLWATLANGWAHCWELAQLGGLIHERMPSTTQFLPDPKSPASQIRPETSNLLVAHHSILLFHSQTSPPEIYTRFSGHATPINHLEWAGTDAFVSAAEQDRHVYYWRVDQAKSASQACAVLILDAPARRLHTWQTSKGQVLMLSISESGTAQIVSLPTASFSTGKGLVTLEPLTQLQTNFSSSELADAQVFAGGERLRIARMVKGVKVILEEVALYNAEQQIPGTIHVSSISKPSMQELDHSTQRYKETGGAAQVRSEVPAHAANAASLISQDGLLPEAPIRGDDEHNHLLADDDMVDEPTLAQRLKALKVQRGERLASNTSEPSDVAVEDERVVPVGGASLASALTQALHSGDQTLLTSCLVHSDSHLIRATVRRISGALAVRLLEACVDRLNRGGSKSKEALGSARARGITEWMYQAMTCHTAYLMSLPDLVARLAQLHHSLAMRLASQQRLLALKGRLELVMNQIDMNRAYTADDAPIQVQGQSHKRSSAKEIDRQQKAQQQQQQGSTWDEPEDDDIEEVGLDTNGYSMAIDEDDEDEGDEDSDEDSNENSDEDMDDVDHDDDDLELEEEDAPSELAVCFTHLSQDDSEAEFSSSNEDENSDSEGQQSESEASDEED
ncbi:Small subunit (SSU) processome component [Malassezia psittaci]|uniref:Small subunit (SSU) processome component n=1 Tax=Malassezia psittaci TaxID=1821823 RepID=A0AAF0FB72_9BASI|nr:Small subunit (SSU) processome component [Malassezia psittaci]